MIWRPVSICSPVKRGPSGSVTPASSGTSSKSNTCPREGSHATSGKVSSSEPASGSTVCSRQLPCISAIAANCCVGSVDWRVARNASATSCLRSDASTGPFGSGSGVASSCGASAASSSPSVCGANTWLIASCACSLGITPSSTHVVAVSSNVCSTLAGSAVGFSSTGRNSS